MSQQLNQSYRYLDKIPQSQSVLDESKLKRYIDTQSMNYFTNNSNSKSIENVKYYDASKNNKLYNQTPENLNQNKHINDHSNISKVDKSLQNSLQKKKSNKNSKIVEERNKKKYENMNKRLITGINFLL